MKIFDSMKRSLVILILALMPISAFAGIDSHKFILTPRVAIPTGENEIAYFGVKGAYEMNINRLILGAGLGLNSEFHHEFLYCNITAPVFIRAGYEITEKFIVSADAGYNILLTGWCLGAGGVQENPRTNGLFIEPQLSYHVTPSIRLSIGTELYNGKFQERFTEITDDAIREYARDVTRFRAGITFGVSFAFGGRK